MSGWGVPPPLPPVNPNPSSWTTKPSPPPSSSHNNNNNSQTPPQPVTPGSISSGGRTHPLISPENSLIPRQEEWGPQGASNDDITEWANATTAVATSPIISSPSPVASSRLENAEAVVAGWGAMSAAEERRGASTTSAEKSWGGVSVVKPATSVPVAAGSSWGAATTVQPARRTTSMWAPDAEQEAPSNRTPIPPPALPSTGAQPSTYGRQAQAQVSPPTNSQARYEQSSPRGPPSVTSSRGGPLPDQGSVFQATGRASSYGGGGGPGSYGGSAVGFTPAAPRGANANDAPLSNGRGGGGSTYGGGGGGGGGYSSTPRGGGNANTAPLSNGRGGGGSSYGGAGGGGGFSSAPRGGNANAAPLSNGRGGGGSNYGAEGSSYERPSRGVAQVQAAPAPNPTMRTWGGNSSETTQQNVQPAQSSQPPRNPLSPVATQSSGWGNAAPTGPPTINPQASTLPAVASFAQLQSHAASSGWGSNTTSTPATHQARQEAPPAEHAKAAPTPQVVLPASGGGWGAPAASSAPAPASDLPPAIIQPKGSAPPVIQTPSAGGWGSSVAATPVATVAPTANVAPIATASAIASTGWGNTATPVAPQSTQSTASQSDSIGRSESTTTRGNPVVALPPPQATSGWGIQSTAPPVVHQRAQVQPATSTSSGWGSQVSSRVAQSQQSQPVVALPPSVAPAAEVPVNATRAVEPQVNGKVPSASGWGQQAPPLAPQLQQSNPVVALAPVISLPATVLASTISPPVQAEVPPVITPARAPIAPVVPVSSLPAKATPAASGWGVPPPAIISVAAHVPNEVAPINASPAVVEPVADTTFLAPSAPRSSASATPRPIPSPINTNSSSPSRPGSNPRSPSANSSTRQALPNYDRVTSGRAPVKEKMTAEALAAKMAEIRARNELDKGRREAVAQDERDAKSVSDAEDAETARLVAARRAEVAMQKKAESDKQQRSATLQAQINATRESAAARKLQAVQGRQWDEDKSTNSRDKLGSSGGASGLNYPSKSIVSEPLSNERTPIGSDTGEWESVPVEEEPAKTSTQASTQWEPPHFETTVVVAPSVVTTRTTAGGGGWGSATTHESAVTAGGAEGSESNKVQTMAVTPSPTPSIITKAAPAASGWGVPPPAPAPAATFSQDQPQPSRYQQSERVYPTKGSHSGSQHGSESGSRRNGAGGGGGRNSPRPDLFPTSATAGTGWGSSATPATKPAGRW